MPFWSTAIAAICALAVAACSDSSSDEADPSPVDADATGGDIDVEGDPGGVADLADTTIDGDPSDCPAPGARAAIVDDGNAIGGLRAQARAGDFLLENGEARFVVQQPTDGIGIVSQYGGTLIDADVVRDGDGQDILGELGTLINVAGTTETVEVTIEADGSDGSDAIVVARGSYALNGYIITEIAVEAVAGFNPFEGNVDPDTMWTIELETRYMLPPCGSALRVEVTATNVGDEPVPFVLAWMIQGGLVDPFVPGQGFVNQVFGTADTVFFESNSDGTDLTYGVVPDVRDETRPLLGFNGALALLHDVTLLELLSFPDGTFQLEPSTTHTVGAWFIVGETAADAISTFHALLSDAECEPFVGRIEEEVTGEGLAGVHVTTLEMRDGVPTTRTVTNARTDDEGTFSLCLPAGPGAVIFGQDGRPYADGGREPEPTAIEVGGSTQDEPHQVFVLPRTGRISLSVVDPDGNPIPARATVLGVDPSPPDSRLDGDGFDPLPPGVIAMADTGDGRIDLLVEPGDIDLVVTRGIEWSLFREEKQLEPGETWEIEVTLHHVVDTSGFLSGDFHVHAAPGPDSTVTYERRAINMAAEGVDVIVATDHAFVTDYNPTIARLGLDSELTSLPGQEITTFASGHFGGFPLPLDDSPNGGAVNWVGLDPVGIAEEVHRRSPDGIFQIMHPRAIPAPGGGNYFSLIDLSFDESGPITGPNAINPLDVRLLPAARWLDRSFNAMEVVTFANVQGLSDWMNLLNAGWRLTATGNSDTHTRWVEGSGYARNLVHVGVDQDTIETFSPGGFIDAVREGRNSVALGVFVDIVVAPDDAAAGMGDTADVEIGATVPIQIRAQTADWLSVNELTLYVNGVAVETREATVERVETSTGGSRHEAVETFEIVASEDAWVAAVATGEESLYPLLAYNWAGRDDVSMEDIRTNALPGTIRPFGLTNPVWIDTDGDGEIAPSHTIVPQDCQHYSRIDRSNPYVVIPASNCGCVRGGAPGCE